MSVYLNTIILVCLICYAQSSSDKSKKAKTEKDFVPSKEWKTIEEGQKVPPGLHYRINLSTGKKEAKIIDSDEEKEQTSTRFLLQGNSDEANLNDDDIEQILKNVNKKNPETDMPKKFRSLDEIKKDLAQIKLQPTNDMDTLRDLFKKIEAEERKRKIDEDSIASILEEFHYLCHKTHNADSFCRMGGFQKIIYKHLNSTSNLVKLETLYLFSTLARHRPNVQVHILESGGITTLLRLISLENNSEVKSAAMSALGSTIRAFPFAQNKFVDIGGLNVFTDLYKTEPIKMKIRIVTLLHDLISERQIDPHNFKTEHFIDLESALVSLGWCSNFNQLLHDVLMVDINDFDSMEKCLLVMDLMAPKCKSFYKNDLILKLHNQLPLLDEMNEDNSDNYFTHLSTLIWRLFQSGSSNSNTTRAEEEL